MPTLKNKQTEIYFEVHGKGEPLLLIAGLASDSQSWAAVKPGLSKEFQIIIFDNRGCGRTNCDVNQISIEGMADDAIAVLDHLQIEKTNVLGHSMGGYVAQQLYLDHPDRVNKLILADTSASTNKRNKVLLNDLVAYRENGMDLKEWFRCFFYWIFTRKFFEDSKVLEANLDFSVHYPYPQSTAQFKKQVEAINVFYVEKRLKEIKNETLILCGKEDILYDPNESIQVLSKIKNSSIAIVEHAAHAIFVENPVDFVESVVGFIQKSRDKACLVSTN
jgi:pimeloyl-ACP methyl ester carboxylesterase